MMLQFALMLLSAHALTCNMWVTLDGTKSAMSEQVCPAGADKCVSYSYKVTSDATGTSTTTNVDTGSCGASDFCDTTKAGVEAVGTLADWKCVDCAEDKCNEDNASGGDSGSKYECSWVVNNYNTENERNIGEASSRSECIAMVMEQCPGATIANMPIEGSGECWCQYGTNMEEDPSSNWMNCLLSEINQDGGTANDETETNTETVPNTEDEGTDGDAGDQGDDGGANNNDSSSSSIAVLIAIAAALFAF